MPTIRLTKEVDVALIKLCGKIQMIKQKKTSASAGVSLLLRFMKQDEESFYALVEKEKERHFPKDYDEKVNTMRNSGIPITKDLTKN